MCIPKSQNVGEVLWVKLFCVLIRFFACYSGPCLSYQPEVQWKEIEDNFEENNNLSSSLIEQVDLNLKVSLVLDELILIKIKLGLSWTNAELLKGSILDFLFVLRPLIFWEL